ncbi:hypothetical protein [Bradyrhizobium sp. RT10b]|uniref:hypothetical protein n=1 Tax=unclassified Bradyrhizobium TaxID=2631580 RepID=UPI0033921878
MKPNLYTHDSGCAQGSSRTEGMRATYIERGSLFESRVRLYHRDGGFYELSARDVRHYLDLMFRGGMPRGRLIRLYKHARRADCLVTRYA